MSQPSANRRLFVCSDWHLGGSYDDLTNADPARRVGTQICRSGAQITRFVDWVAEEARAFGGLTELVVNGDSVDFLSPDGTEDPVEWEGDEQAVIRKLRRIMEGGAKGARGPFDAIADFLRLPRTEFTLLLGNHDVELCLPAVRKYLEEKCGRTFRFVFDGEAYTRGRVLIEHGNRYDAWNALRYGHLRRERSLLSRGLPVDESKRDMEYFRAPAGTMLVIHAMNSIQSRFPFINLLKPETGAAVPLLLAIVPELAPLLKKIAELGEVPQRLREARLATAVLPEDIEYLNAMPGIEDALEAVLRDSLGDRATEFLNPVQGEEGQLNADAPLDRREWIRQVGRSVTNRFRETAVKLSEAADEWRLSRLDAAFEALAADRTFDPSKESKEYLSAATKLLEGGRYDVVIFGHTHLPKDIPVPRKGRETGRYINTGTWADVIQLTPELCAAGGAGRQARRAFIADMENHHLTPHLFRSFGYAEIELSGDTVTSARLRSFTEANPRANALERSS